MMAGDDFGLHIPPKDDRVRDQISSMANLANTASKRIYQSMSDMTREEIDAKIAASEARGDTKFTRIDGRLDAVIDRLDEIRVHLSAVSSDNKSTRTTVVTTGIAVVLGLAALILSLPSIYSLGANTRDIVRSEVQQALPPVPAPINPPAVQSPAVTPSAVTPPAAASTPITPPRT